jgi:DNA-binding transcriptional MocR family regulator
MQARALVELLGPWSAGQQPLNEQLATSITGLIEGGSLPAGTRIPSERELSAALGVSRTTVVAAYDRLRTSGAVRSRRGSGTRVAWRTGPRPTTPARPAAASALAPEVRRTAIPYEDDRSVAGGGAIQLTIGAFRAPEIVAEEIEHVAREDAREMLKYFGYLPAGLPALREAVAAHLGDLGVPTIAEQIVITNGAQQAIDLVARTLAGPSGTVIIENPTYSGAINAFRSAGPRLIPVPVDADGLLVELVGLHADRRTGQLVYVVPTYQNPTGAVLSDRRRDDLIRVASDAGLMIVEDLTASYLSYEGEAPPPLAARDAEQVVTIGSLSKVAWGGLRVGWIRAPRSHVARFAAAKAELDLGVSLLSQAVAVRLLGRIDELQAAAQHNAIERLDVIAGALTSRLPAWSWQRPKGGICLWVRLPGGDGTAFARLAMDYGVIVRAGTTLSVDGSFVDRIRIAFGEDPDRLREAVDRLAAAWAAFEPSVLAVRPEATISV